MFSGACGWALTRLTRLTAADTLQGTQLGKQPREAPWGAVGRWSFRAPKGKARSDTSRLPMPGARGRPGRITNYLTPSELPGRERAQQGICRTMAWRERGRGRLGLGCLLQTPSCFLLCFHLLRTLCAPHSSLAWPPSHSGCQRVPFQAASGSPGLGPPSSAPSS